MKLGVTSLEEAQMSVDWPRSHRLFREAWKRGGYVHQPPKSESHKEGEIKLKNTPVRGEVAAQGPEGAHGVGSTKT